MTNPRERFHLLLVRHGRDPKPGSKAEAEHNEVGQRLADTLAALRGSLSANQINIDHVLRFDSEPAGKTADALKSYLSLVRESESLVEQVLTPNFASSYSEPEQYEAERQTVVDRVLDDVRRTAGEAGAGNAIAVVGHEPQLSVLASQLTSSSFRHRAVPLARTEIACLFLPRSDIPPATPKCGTWTLAWSISPSDPEAERDLRQKVGSKMQVAGILGAAVTAALVFLLQNLFETRDTVTSLSMQLRYISAVSLFFAASLYILALYFCDQLMMPTRFWSQTSADPGTRPTWLVARPPSPAPWIVYQNMMRVWSSFFTPACFALGVGILTLFFSLSVKSGCVLCELTVPSLYLLVGTILVVLVARYRRPRLGVKD